MAHIKYIYLHDHDWKESQMTVSIALKPDAQAQIKVPIPDRFYSALIRMAQTAADAHEAKMRAEILGDESPTIIEDDRTRP